MIKKRLEEMLEQAKAKKDYFDESYNCHGLTCYLMGWEQNLRWVEPEEMSQKLLNLNKKNNTSIIRNPGEIMAIEINNKYASHTATYLGEGKYLQKKGRGPLEVTYYPQLRETYKGAVERLLVK